MRHPSWIRIPARINRRGIFSPFGAGPLLPALPSLKSINYQPSIQTNNMLINALTRVKHCM